MAAASSDPRLALIADKGGVRVAVRLTPKAFKNAVGGVIIEDGGARLKVFVTAPPEDGKANRALIKLLAKEWKLPKSDITITRGLTNARKTVLVAGNRQDLSGRLDAWQAKLEQK
ncbi:MAG: DUF167 domain-containing protein [Rhodospirillales bacterium]|nr:DUF167 domain-containing protein [Rhodospirillales bacterium]